MLHLKDDLIIVVMLDNFHDGKLYISGKNLDSKELEEKLMQAFEYRIHLCENTPEAFSFFEKLYFDDSYRAYTRPYDTPEERLLAQELMQSIINHHCISDRVKITYLYKQKFWNDQFKTYYIRNY